MRWAVVAWTGQGSVVLFADNTAQREYWTRTGRLLRNALLLSDQRVPSGRR